MECILFNYEAYFTNEVKNWGELLMEIFLSRSVDIRSRTVLDDPSNYCAAFSVG